MSVAIVGAGPGDPGLITVRALELVEASDVLVYDRLVSAQLVARAARARRIQRDGLTQEQVNHLLIHHGSRGSRVVRLKGGDPFVFGRGGEEVAALVAAGIPYELVPGVSTLTAAPALAGIPLTYRDIASEVTVLAGTTADDREVDFRRLAASPGTLVVFMGLRRLDALTAGLIEAGRPVDEPAAVISRASWTDEQVVVGTLRTIAEAARDVPPPALVVIGAVADIERMRSMAGEAACVRASIGAEAR